jgi:hypothetical protein
MDYSAKRGTKLYDLKAKDIREGYSNGNTFLTEDGMLYLLTDKGFVELDSGDTSTVANLGDTLFREVYVEAEYS